MSNFIWKVSDYTRDSDHFPIKFSLNNFFDKYKSCRLKLDIRRINWVTFKTKWSRDLLSAGDYESFVSDIRDIVCESETRNAYKNFRENPSIENQIEYQRVKALNCKKIKKIRKNKFRNKCNSLNRL